MMNNRIVSIGFLAVLVITAAALPAAATLAGQHHFIELAEDWQAMGFDLDCLEPEFVATTPDGGGALITIQEGNAVAVVNHSKLVKIIKLPDESEPDGIAISPDGKVAVTANEEGQSISLIDLSHGLAGAELTGTIDVLQFLPMDDPNFKHDGGEVDPEGVAMFNRAGRSYAVLALEKSASLLVLDVTDPDNVTNVSLLPVGITGDLQNPDDREAEPEGVATSPGSDLIAVGNEEEGTVSLIPILSGNAPSFGERVNFDPSGKEAEIVAFTPDRQRLLVTNSKENTLIILNISDLANISEEQVLDLSGYGEPTSVAASPDGNFALVSIADGVNPTVNPGKVLAFCLLSYDLLAEFSVGQVPDSIGITPDGNYAFIANEAENEDIPEDDEIAGSISVIDLGTCPIRGDLNCDNEITLADAMIVLSMAVSGKWDENADVSGDGCITALDALMILQMVAGAAGGESPSTLQSNLSLQHPRRGHQLTLSNGKLWVTGGKAYYSHFLNWGGGYQEFTTYPNAEYIDPANGAVVYTDVAIKTPDGKAKDFYKATAFTACDNDSIIYIAGDKELLKFDTSKADAGDAIIEIEDPGELQDWRQSIWGRMVIGEKVYVVLIGEDCSFFEVEIEQFVNLPGVDAEFPEMITDVVNEDLGGCVIDNKFYLFGGTKSDESGSVKAWTFDPGAVSGDGWASISDMPFGVKSPRVESVGDRAYIIGGLTAGYMYKEIFEYDPADDTYTRKVDLPCPTYKHDTAVFGDQIWVSYGYSWGTEEEGRYGFRMHPPHLVCYSPLCDDTVQDTTGTESVSGKKMNLNIGLPDPANITGTEQTIAINWMASTSSARGVVYFREVGEIDWDGVDAMGTLYYQVFSEAKAYTATLTGLKPGTGYEYYVVSEGEGTEEVQSGTYIYKTQPEAGGSFQFIAYGDSKAQYDVLHELNCQILEEMKVIASGNGNDTNDTNGAFVLQLGDFGAYADISEWESWFEYGFNGCQCTKEMAASYAFVPVHGNHEYLAPSWFNTFEMPRTSMGGWPDLNNTGYAERWYSFNYGSTHIAVITTGEYSGEDWYQTQLEWLDADLTRAKALKEAGAINWVIVAMHHSPFTSGDHFPDQGDYGLFEEGSYVDVIDLSGAVDVVLAAHDHDYERSKMIRGFRWTGEAEGTGEPAFYRLDNASVVAESGHNGSANQGNGTVWLTLGGAGAGQRDMQELDDLGDSSWIAFRKPNPALGEYAETNPCFHYSVITVTPDVLEIAVYEKDISYLPDWTGADDDFEGLLDCVTIHGPT